MTAVDALLWAPTAHPSGARFGLVASAAIPTDVFRSCTAWIVLPEETEDPVPPLCGLIRETRELTGWAQRDLAQILGTSHTTIGRLETDGRVTARSRSVAARATELHAVLVRLARVASSPEALMTALHRTVRGTTPQELLSQGQWSQAYIAALDALRGPRPELLGASAVPVRAATREIRP